MVGGRHKENFGLSPLATTEPTEDAMARRLAALSFQSQQPQPPLDSLVKTLWSACNCSEVERIEEYWHTDGGLGIVFCLGGRVSIGQRVYGPGAYFDQDQVRTTRVAMAPGCRLLGVRFAPGCVRRFFDERIQSLVGQPHTQQNLRGELAELVAVFRSVAAPLDALEEWLRSRLRASTPSMDLAVHALSLLREPNGKLTPELPPPLTVSPRTLQRAFRDCVGISPQQVGAIQRVSRARALVQSGVPLASAAAAAGYYDQAHFTHEFRKIVGLSPGRYLQRRQTAMRQHQVNATQPPSA